VADDIGMSAIRTMSENSGTLKFEQHGFEEQ
jgi:hypothetical protein